MRFPCAWQVSTGIELITISAAPVRIASAGSRPEASAEILTSSSSGPLLSMTMTTSAVSQAADGVAAIVTPYCVSFSALARSRFHTTVGNPACASRRAMCAPMMPVPMRATLRAMRSARDRLLHRRELLELRRLLVVRVERIAARDDAVARRRGAVAEGAAIAFLVRRAALEDVERQFRIGQHPAPAAAEIDPAAADHRLRDVREEVLQVCVAAAHQAEVGERLLQFAHDFELAHDADERILRRMIAVGRRIERRANDVRIVIGAGGRDVDETDAEPAHDLEERLGFGELVFERVLRIAAEGVAIWDRVFFRDARTKR